MHRRRERQQATVCPILICDDGGPSWWYHCSWDEMKDYDRDHGRHIIDSVKMMSGPRLVEARSETLESALRTRAEWFLTIDSDMGWEPDALDRMLDICYAGDADGKMIKVLGGLCFAGGTEDRGIYPTIYGPKAGIDNNAMFAPEPVCKIVMDKSEHGNLPRFVGNPYPRDTLMKVMATGAAFMLIHRDVVALLAAPHPAGFGTTPDGHPNPYPWYADTTQWGRTYGEDIVFCQRAAALGFGVYVHTAIKVDHYKMGALLAERVWDMRLNAYFGFDANRYREVPPPPEPAPTKELVLP